MDRIRAILGEIRDFLRRNRAEADLKEELDFHLDMAFRANLTKGMAPAEARRMALVEFGGRDRYTEEVRNERRGALLLDLLRDLKFGARVILKRPVFSLAAILTLSIGVGMTATMFTVVDAVILRPLPGANAEGMVYLSLESSDGKVGTSPSPELLRRIRGRMSAFSRVEAYAARDYSFSVNGEPFRGMGAVASTGFFSFLGIRAQLGRLFLPRDGQGSEAPVVVLSHTLWTERFGGERDVLGQVMVIGNQTHEIVGVLPRDFRVDAYREALFWTPEGAAGDLLADGTPVAGALARLAGGVTPEAAEAELNAIVQNDPLARRGERDWVARVKRPGELVAPSLKKAILLLQAGALLVLLIACLNLVNLLLAQGEARSRELAVRSSLGAGKGRLVRQLLAETAVLGVLGCMGGILLTSWALQSLPLFLPPGYAGFALNRQVLFLAGGCSFVAVLGAGLLPALRGSKRGLMEVIKGASQARRGLRKRPGLRQILVTAEVALAFVLLVSAGLLIKSFSGLMASDVGFPTENLVTMRVDLPETGYENPAAQSAFLDGLREGIRNGFPAQLGSATVASGLVNHLAAAIGPIIAEEDTGQPEADQESQILLAWRVSPGYFDVLGLPLSQGRGFREDEGSGGEKVVVINAEVAQRAFPRLDAAGKLLQVGGEWRRVVGVARTMKLPGLAQNTAGPLQIFLPLKEDVGRGLTIIARLHGDRAAAIQRLKEVVWALDRSLPIQEVSTVTEALSSSLSEERSNALLMALFALTALALGAVGIYGVVAYSVSRRTREMGIRMALGASSGGVVGRVVAEGMSAVALGVLLGGAGALLLGSTFSGLLADVSPRDPAVFLAVGVTTGVVALAASWLPARRAAKSNPLETLTAE